MSDFLTTNPGVISRATMQAEMKRRLMAASQAEEGRSIPRAIRAAIRRIRQPMAALCRPKPRRSEDTQR